MVVVFLWCFCCCCDIAAIDNDGDDGDDVVADDDLADDDDSMYAIKYKYSEPRREETFENCDFGEIPLQLDFLNN